MGAMDSGPGPGIEALRARLAAHRAAWPETCARLAGDPGALRAALAEHDARDAELLCRIGLLEGAGGLRVCGQLPSIARVMARLGRDRIAARPVPGLLVARGRRYAERAWCLFAGGEEIPRRRVYVRRDGRLEIHPVGPGEYRGADPSAAGRGEGWPEGRSGGAPEAGRQLAGEGPTAG